MIYCSMQPMSNERPRDCPQSRKMGWRKKIRNGRGGKHFGKSSLTVVSVKASTADSDAAKYCHTRRL